MSANLVRAAAVSLGLTQVQNCMHKSNPFHEQNCWSKVGLKCQLFVKVVTAMSSDLIKLNVGGERIDTSLTTLCSEPRSTLVAIA